MEDLLKKIQSTENDAQTMLKDAEKEASSMIDKAKSDSTKKIEEARKEVYVKYTSQKENEISAAKDKKLKMVSDQVKDYENKFGNIEAKKKKAEEYLIKIIKDRVGF
jgi:vacuolar-type H+-ATPase subunit H